MRLTLHRIVFCFTTVLLLACTSTDDEQITTDIELTADLEPVDTLATVGYQITLAFDADRNPRVLYQDVSLGALRYAYRDSDQWILETIPGGDGHGEASLTLDGSGRAHVAYRRQTGIGSAELLYACRTQSGWSYEIVDAEGWVGSWNSIALDDRGTIHIAYFSGYPDYDLRFATKINGVWSKELVDSDDATGYGASMAVAADGAICIAYGVSVSQDIDQSGLRVARLISNEWAIDTVDLGHLTGHHISMLADKDGQIHVAYRSGSDRNDTDLNSAASYNDGWEIETIDKRGDIGYTPSLTIDQFGRLWVAYAVPLENTVRAAFWQNFQWRVTDVAGIGASSALTIKVDPENHLAVAVGIQDGLYYGNLRKKVVQRDPAGSLVGP